MQSHVFATLTDSLLAGTAANCAAANPGSVRCKIDAKDITISDSRADFNHSPSGVKGRRNGGVQRRQQQRRLYL